MSTETSVRPRTNPSSSSQFSSSARQGSSSTKAETGASGGSQEHIARRAYEIWERNGRQDGQCEQNWRQAEDELRRA